jgi:sugar O-acyltransferase (sialic acid O-acetyltransferase NeuD family)
VDASAREPGGPLPGRPEPLVIVGAGGFGRETAQAVLGDERWKLLGFLDDDPDMAGRQIEGTAVLGSSVLLGELPDARVVVCVGSPRNRGARARVVERLALPPQRYATVIHPSADVSASSVVGAGSVLLAQTVLTASVRVGAHVAVMPQVVLTHDVAIADYVTIASGVRLSGGVRVGRGAYLGAGALVREQVTIGREAMVGLGAVVLADVPTGEVWVGNPAHRLRSVPISSAL